jgi:hypothetical protein
MKDTKYIPYIKQTISLLLILLLSYSSIIQVFAGEADYNVYLPIINNPTSVPGIPGTNTYYISPDGDDSHSGLTEELAWHTFNRAWQNIYPGDSLILLDGIYYQSLNPNKRNGEPGIPITIKAKNDGKAIIDGEYQRDPIKLGDTWPGPIGNYFVIEGIVGRNAHERVIRLVNTRHNVLRRVSAYNANTDSNHHVISISGSSNLIEDCVAAGTGRKMISIFQSDDNIIRRCFTYWIEWDGRNMCINWPNGQSIQVYHGQNNIIENSIAIGPVPQWSISIQANSPNAVAIGNKVLGSIAINAGMNLNGTIKQWGEIRPQPTDCTGMENFDWPNRRSGFSLHGPGEIRNNLFQDIFSWGNAGLGLVENIQGPHSNNRIIRATIYNNGIDNPDGPWPGIFGGVDTDVLQNSFTKFDLVENSYIEKIFINWPGYPAGERNLTSMEGEGARLTHRYKDGVLTDIPLWPWPMEERIQNELGISVTEMITGLIFDKIGSEYGMNNEIFDLSQNENTIEIDKDINIFNISYNGCYITSEHLQICSK